MGTRIELGKEGCFVKVRGYRRKHIVISDDHIGHHLPNCVTVKEIKSGEERHTTWRQLSEWHSVKPAPPTGAQTAEG